MTNQNTEEELILRSIARLRAGIVAIVFGMLSGTAVFLATIWLLIRGGRNVGEHLQLLGHFLPGYTVTPVGAVIGAFWATLAGAALGFTVALVYNLVAGRRSKG